MKRYRLLLVILLCAAFTIPLWGETKFVTYKNESFNYEIRIPESWHTVDLNLKDRHIMYAYPDKSIEIKVKALRSGEEDMDKIIRNNKWNLRDVDSRLNKIIETGKISIKQNVEGKLLVFEYRAQKNTMLQRTLVTVNGGIVYVIECKSPVKKFYDFDEIFNTALRSFNFMTTGMIKEKADESTDDRIKSAPKGEREKDTSEDFSKL